MRSIKIGILALYCLLCTLHCFDNLEFDEKWSFADYANSALALSIGLFSVVLIMVCALTPTKIKDISVKLDSESVEALVKAFKEREDETP